MQAGRVGAQGWGVGVVQGGESGSCCSSRRCYSASPHAYLGTLAGCLRIGGTLPLGLLLRRAETGKRARNPTPTQGELAEKGGAAGFVSVTTSVAAPHAPPLACGPPLPLPHACAGSLPPVAHIGGTHTCAIGQAVGAKVGRTGGTHNDTHHATRTSARLRAASASATRLRWASSYDAQRHAHAHPRSFTPVRRARTGVLAWWQRGGSTGSHAHLRLLPGCVSFGGNLALGLLLLLRT